MDSIKQRILKERGLVRVDKRNTKRHSFDGHRPVPNVVIDRKRKTPLMLYLEEKYHVLIETALVSGSLSVVAKKFGDEVDMSTISRWITRFKLRYTANNLPICEGCTHANMACNGGVCAILMELEEWDLMMVKRDQLLDPTKPM